MSTILDWAGAIFDEAVRLWEMPFGLLIELYKSPAGLVVVLLIAVTAGMLWIDTARKRKA